MNDFIKVNREAVNFNITPQQQAAVLLIFEPLFNELVDRMALKAKQLCNEAKPRFYGRREIADLLRVSLPTVHGYVKDGRLTPLKINGKTLFNASEVDKLIESGSLRKYSRS